MYVECTRYKSNQKNVGNSHTHNYKLENRRRDEEKGNCEEKMENVKCILSTSRFMDISHALLFYIILHKPTVSKNKQSTYVTIKMKKKNVARFA